MKLLLIYGDSAVGKMTVGQELMKITDLRLFHNHMSIEPIIEIFGYLNGAAVHRFRDVVFEEFAKTDAYGLIFTCMFAFDMPSDYEYIDHVVSIFKEHGAEIYCAELVAPQSVRLERNRTENRLLHKPTKRDVAVSDERLIRDDENHRMESREGEIPFENYIKIDNANLSAADTAKLIKEKFSL